MGVIRVLPQSLISRIAAGECIERPASVVKELVENALDAGASQIDVTLADGGRELIAVTDDGGGMDPDDLVLAVTQHATSKIREDDDLFNIQTMGFRGEALASIASIARVRIISRRPGADVGCELVAEGGEIRPPRPISARTGTTIEVRDLFYATPARRKFLKTNQTEVGHVTEQIARIALAHPGVGFTLSHGGRPMHNLPATADRRQRIGDFYGEDLARVLIPVQRAGTGLTVDGLVAPPAESRGSGKWEYVFLNGRYIRDRFVSHAVKEAYRSLIDPHRFPVAFLFLTVTPTDVDVNVHPTKIEVRWRDSNYVHGQVLAALREKFLSSRFDHRLQAPGEEEVYRERVRTAMVEFFTGPGRSAGPASPTTSRTSPANAPGPAPNAGGAPSVPAFTAAEPPGAAPQTSPGMPVPDAVSDSLRPPAIPAAPIVRAAATRALQIHRSYLVVETADGLMIIDQHALHERILYEELRKRIAERALESQRLLLAEVVRVAPDRLEAVEEHADLLARLGIELTVAGPQSVALQAFPTLLQSRVEQAAFVRDLLDILAEHGRRPGVETLIHDILDMMACKAAVKAGDPLAPDEITALVERREIAERSSHCPHGRPTTLRLTLRDLERQFHRR
jgi:DNA mismatch repair protein MutL